MVDVATADQKHVKSAPAVSSNRLRRTLTWLSKVCKDRKFLALLGILALGAYLRLWNIHHLFNIFEDFDEGVYSLGARFISQGYLPYQDFTLCHPPLYDLVLASVYKIFGYGFFEGRYFSVALSVACIILIYLVGKKMYHPTAGIVAAALFAVSPDMVYFGRLAVQETLGIFLILLAIYFAIDFIQNKKRNRIFLCGLALGLAVATKYLFIPAAIAIILTIILLTMGERFWESLKTLGRPVLWLIYLCFASIFCSLLMILKWSMKLDVSIPFFEPLYWSVDDVAVTILIFLLPLVISLVILERNLPIKQWWFGLWGLRHNHGLRMLLAGSVLGFIFITGFFWAKAPQEFLSQTILLQQNRLGTTFPSLVEMIRYAPSAPASVIMDLLPVLFVIPLVFALLNKRGFSKSDCFLSMTLVVSFAFCQLFPTAPRYYVSAFPFLLLGISQFMPPLDTKMLASRFEMLSSSFKAGVLVVSSVSLIFMSVTIVQLTTWTGYDVFRVGFPSIDEHVYRETIDYLEGAGAKKIYADNPTFSALSPNLDSTLAFDTFALLWLEDRPPERIVRDMIDEGVDYVVLSPWLNIWGDPYKKEVPLAEEVRRNARLVKVIAPNPLFRVNIYMLGAKSEGVFNGDFDRWVEYKDKEIRLPLGWDPVLITGDGDRAVIEETYIAGEKCVGFIIYEDGLRDDKYDSTKAGIVQDILFPEIELKVQVFPTVNTVITGRALGPSIDFVDSHGHSLMVGFSDEVDGEELIRYGDGSRISIVKNAQLYQWSEHTIDLLAYWNQAGWQQPEKIRVCLVISTYYSQPGYYALYVAKVETEGAKAGTIK